MEKIVAAVSTAIRVDSLDIPAGVSVIGLDDNHILARCRKEMANKDPVSAGHAAGFLAEAGGAGRRGAPGPREDVEDALKPSEVAGAAWVAGRLGRPLGRRCRSVRRGQVGGQGRGEHLRESIGVIEKAKPGADR